MLELALFFFSGNAILAVLFSPFGLKTLAFLFRELLTLLLLLDGRGNQEPQNGVDDTLGPLNVLAVENNEGLFLPAGSGGTKTKLDGSVRVIAASASWGACSSGDSKHILDTTRQDRPSVDMDVNTIRASDNAETWRCLPANGLHNGIHEADGAIHGNNTATCRVQRLAPIGESISSNPRWSGRIWAVSPDKKRISAIVVAVSRNLGSVDTVVRLDGNETGWATRHDFSDGSPGRCWGCAEAGLRMSTGHWRFIAFPSPWLKKIIVFWTSQQCCEKIIERVGLTFHILIRSLVLIEIIHVLVKFIHFVFVFNWTGCQQGWWLRRHLLPQQSKEGQTIFIEVIDFFVNITT